MSRRGDYYPESRQSLTVGDGFRIGCGIAFWLVAVQIVLYVVFIVLF